MICRLRKQRNVAFALRAVTVALARLRVSPLVEVRIITDELYDEKDLGQWLTRVKRYPPTGRQKGRYPPTRMTQGIEKLVSTVLENLPSVVTGFKYGGWTIDELAHLFGITPAKAAQKVNAYRTTGGILWREDRVRVCAMHLFEVECRRVEEYAKASTEQALAGRIGCSDPHARLRLAADRATRRERPAFKSRI